MNPIIYTLLNGKKHYLSTKGKWIKSKKSARVFSNTAEAQEIAKTLQARVDFYIFRN